VIDRELELLEGTAQASVGGELRIDELGESGTDEASVGAGEEESCSETEVGDPVAVAPRDPLDEAVEAEPAEFVAEPALAQLIRV